MRKRISYSQNFLKDKRLVSKLVEMSSLNKADIVIEVGAGQGIITLELLRKCRKVVAFEIDRNLFNKLAERFQNYDNLDLRFEDFLSYNLPVHPYKFFSNIPFNITSAIVKKLIQSDSPPEDAYLIIQKEAARKFFGKPYDNKNSLLAILTKPWFDLEVSYEFERHDFFPKPNVYIVLLRITKRVNPLVSDKDKGLYLDFVTYTFNQFQPNIGEGLSEVFGKNRISDSRKPSELSFNDWLDLFEKFTNEIDSKHQQIVKGSYLEMTERESRLQKIHRSRTDKNWRLRRS